MRINVYKVEEKQQAKQAVKSEYFPSIRNESNFVHLTDTKLIQIYPGSLGTVAGSPIPPTTAVINQGGRDLTTSGTQLTQPLTTLLKIRRENDIAQAELKSSRQSAQQMENDVALKIHQLYYKILIEQVHRSATEARIKASQDLQSERVEQVKYGSTLQENLIESRAQLYSRNTKIDHLICSSRTSSCSSTTPWDCRSQPRWISIPIRWKRSQPAHGKRAWLRHWRLIQDHPGAQRGGESEGSD